MDIMLFFLMRKLYNINSYKTHRHHKCWNIYDVTSS